jgi:pimeloyl-ACP methyl ester carboxylesterase
MLDGLAHGLLANPGPGGQFAYRDALSGHEHQGLGVPRADVGEARVAQGCVEAYDRWLASSPDVPKLLLTFDPGPGIMIGPDLADWCRRHIPALEVAACGPAGHHAPEDQPAAIAAAIAAWAGRHGLRDPSPAGSPTRASAKGDGRS